MFLALGMLSGCGDNVTVAQESQVSMAQKSTMTIVDVKTREFQFTIDNKGNLKDLRDGGVEIKPGDVDYVVYSSYRFGDWATSLFKVSMPMEAPYKVKFTGLPNNDQWGEYYVVLKSGKKFQMELASFDVVELPGLYYWINPSESGMEYGDIEADSAQDEMRLSLDTATMKATLKGQFGCDLIFGTLSSVTFEPGLKVVAELGDGSTYAGNIIQGADGNLPYELPAFPVATGPYTYPGYVFNVDYPAYDPTVIKDIYILKLDGTKVSFKMRYNTPETEQDQYLWYLETYNPTMAGSLSADEWESNVITLKYYPVGG